MKKSCAAFIPTCIKGLDVISCFRRGMIFCSLLFGVHVYAAVSPVIEKPVFACGNGTDTIKGTAGSFIDDGDDGSIELFERDDYTAFESGLVRPIALSPDESLLFVANTSANCLEIYSITDADGSGNDHDKLTLVSSVRVGIEPVSVAALSNTEVWVVNHLSDSVSVVNWSSTTQPMVRKTLLVGDEPRDIVFADGSNDGDSVNDKTHAFITAAYRGQHHPDFYDDTENEQTQDKLFEEGIGRADIWVFDVDDYDNDGTANASDTTDDLGGTPETIINVFTNTPRALEVTPDGKSIFVAGFMTGNQTTISPLLFNQEDKKKIGNYLTHDDLQAPLSGLIVKWDEGDSKWYDETMFDDDNTNDSNIDWSEGVALSLPDKDVFKLNVHNIDSGGSYSEAGYSAGVGTHLFNMAYDSANDKLYVSNIDARNVNRFVGGDFDLKGHFVEQNITSIDVSGSSPYSNSVYHLNDHIDFDAGSWTTTEKENSFSQPVNLVIDTTNSRLFMASFGTGNVGYISLSNLDGTSMNGDFSRIDLAQGDAGESAGVDGGGPSGLALGYSDERLFVYTRFDNTVAIYDVSGTPARLDKVEMFNPEPQSIIDGRPFLYDSHLTSANGTVSCGSCHIYGDMDLLAWDLGDPNGYIVQIPVGANGIPFSSSHLDSFGNINFLGADFSTTKSLGDTVKVGNTSKTPFEGVEGTVEVITDTQDFADKWANNSTVTVYNGGSPTSVPIQEVDGVILIDGTEGPTCTGGCTDSNDKRIAGFEFLLDDGASEVTRSDWGNFSENDTFCQDGSTPSGSPLTCSDGRAGYTIKKGTDFSGSTLVANSQQAFLARNYDFHWVQEYTTGDTFTGDLGIVDVSFARQLWDNFDETDGVDFCSASQQNDSTPVIDPAGSCDGKNGTDTDPYHVYKIQRGFFVRGEETGYTPTADSNDILLRLNEWWAMYHFVGSTIYLDGDISDTTFDFANFHSMKGPKTTQSLRGLADSGALHWRGDKTGCVGSDCNGTQVSGVNKGQEWHAFTQFNEAFVGLLGMPDLNSPSAYNPEGLSTTDMGKYADFAMQLTYPPNPIRNLDNTLTSGTNGSNQAQGMTDYLTKAVLFNNSDTCNTCHALPNQDGNLSAVADNHLFGTDKTLTFESAQQFIKVPQLRNMYQKVGMFGLGGLSSPQGDQIAGFGYLNEGFIDTLVNFFDIIFQEKDGGGTGIPGGDIDVNEATNIAEFVMAFPNNVAPMVGQQVTLREEHFSADWDGSDSVLDADVKKQLGLLIEAAAAGECDLLKTDVIESASRSFKYKDGNMGTCDTTYANSFGGGPYDESACFIQDNGDDSFSDGVSKYFISRGAAPATFTCYPPGDLDRFVEVELFQGDSPLPSGVTVSTSSYQPAGSPLNDYEGYLAFDGGNDSTNTGASSVWQAHWGPDLANDPEWIQFNFSGGEDIRQFAFQRRSSQPITNYPEELRVWGSNSDNSGTDALEGAELLGEFVLEDISEGSWDEWRDIKGGSYTSLRFEIHSVHLGGTAGSSDERPVIQEIQFMRKK